jgi:hypothetical protein
MIFGKIPHDVVPLPLKLNGHDLEYVSEWKYLGTLITAGKKFSFSAKNDLRSFYCASNAILTVLHKPNEEIMMKILYSNCIPILTYACDIKFFSAKEMTQCNTAVNDSICKIFSYNRWESTRKIT